MKSEGFKLILLILSIVIVFYANATNNLHVLNLALCLLYLKSILE